MWYNYLNKPTPHASESFKNSSWAETKTAIAIIAAIAVVWAFV